MPEQRNDCKICYNYIFSKKEGNYRDKIAIVANFEMIIAENKNMPRIIKTSCILDVVLFSSYSLSDEGSGIER